MRAELVEWKGVDRTPIHPRYQDPGAATLIFTVRDLTPILARVKKAAAPIVTTGGEPVRLNDSKAIMLRDPDGFYVELIQPDSPPAAPASNMLSVSFAFTVSDTERMMKIFRDALGFQPQPSALQYDKPRLALRWDSPAPNCAGPPPWSPAQRSKSSSRNSPGVYRTPASPSTAVPVTPAPPSSA